MLSDSRNHSPDSINTLLWFPVWGSIIRELFDFNRRGGWIFGNWFGRELRRNSRAKLGKLPIGEYVISSYTGSMVSFRATIVDRWKIPLSLSLSLGEHCSLTILPSPWNAKHTRRSFVNLLINKRIKVFNFCHLMIFDRIWKKIYALITVFLVLTLTFF